MSRSTVLLVEDNPQDEKLILRSLKRVNLANAVHVARDGQQALDYLTGTGDHAGRDIHDVPVVILLDIGLPRLSGLDVLAAVRGMDHVRHVPVVILTSSDEDRDRLRSYQNGANSFVRKPLDFTEFAETVANLGVYWVVTNVPPP